MLKLMKRTGIYKNSTGKCVFNPYTMSATSYDWWSMLQVIKGKVVFNKYRYSVTTAKHQRELLMTLNSLGIKVDASIEAPRGLQNLEDAELYLSIEMKNTNEAIKKTRKGTKKLATLIKRYRDLAVQHYFVSQYKGN